MFRIVFIGALVVLTALPLHAQPMPEASDPDTTSAQAYRVFRPDGTAATLEDVVAAMGQVDVVFLGEQHDDPVAHQLQAELLMRAYGEAARQPEARPIALSMEMFERDVQPILDEYLADLISESHFLRSSRPWRNYETDYKPLVEFAKAHGMAVVAANAPRRYVNRVSRKGPSSLDTLSAWAKSWLPPLPFPGPSAAYEAKWNRMLAEMMAPKKDAASADTAAHRASVHKPSMPDSTAKHHTSAEGEGEAKHGSSMHGAGFMLDAQAFWDAAMAYAIHKHLEKAPEALVVHVAGSFHVEEGLGMPAKLEGYRPGTRQLIIITKATEDFITFDAEAFSALGDFIILTDKSQPRSFDASSGE